MRRVAVALAVLLAVWLAVVVHLAAGAYGGTQPPACVVLHVAATPFSPAWPLTVCGTHLTGRWRCEPASLMHGLTLACKRPAESNAGSRQSVKMTQVGTGFMRSARRTPPRPARKGGTQLRWLAYPPIALIGTQYRILGRGS